MEDPQTLDISLNLLVCKLGSHQYRQHQLPHRPRLPPFQKPLNLPLNLKNPSGRFRLDSFPSSSSFMFKNLPVTIATLRL
ncbi:Hypothetical predicted protein [Xyrichtys novacula]|uniref:Uncharacterized protein n=1 Tax=Xyrichtys novacula TaxID=13765 RepID=A0AAV1F4H4_XYRNO|nr:Hypothetical predicted protein [Xyrichtys novacula]